MIDALVAFGQEPAGLFILIFLSGILMSAIALVGAVHMLLDDATMQKLLLPLVAFSAGSLMGGAFFHMIPASIENLGDFSRVSVLVLAGFCAFFVLEQFLHWHHCHRAEVDCKKPLTYLILIGDGLHNFLGGLAIAGTFLIDVRLGVISWLAAAAHEVPQELGDFGVLVHGGWSKSQALLFNVLSALAFLVGSMLAYAVSFAIDVTWLVPIAAGNFIYIAASDLIPEIRGHPRVHENMLYLVAFVAGLALLYLARMSFGE
ncbi:MAG TPA: ZIP family metal transporter [Gammaproteobacteria bacterium]|jgi:zinc and cadmium transporter